MDERHWWIANRVSQTFAVESSSSGFLERFICEASNLEKINTFLCMNGSNKLFFCGLKAAITHYTDLLVCDNLLKIPKTFVENVDDSIILYFIRHDTTQEVSPTHIYKEVYCGEIRNVSQILYNVYSDLLFSMFESNQHWNAPPLSSSSTRYDMSKLQSVRNMEKCVNAISEFSADNQNLKNMMLKRVDPEVLNELKQARISPDSPIIKYCEDLALDWISTIENILSDICDERFIHQSVGPNSELERWQRKQRLLSNLTEQLKTKECKSVMSALITSKSRILKKWKIIDTGITDAQNECRDKVKFLESLKRPIDQFYYEATPVSCITTALPNLCTAMRTVESVSRYYARQGYLGLLFTKVTNQIVNICKEYLLELAHTINNELVFWPAIIKEIDDFDNAERQLDIQLEFNLLTSVSVNNKTKSIDLNELLNKTGESLFIRLKSCLIVQSKYKEAFRNLRDSLGGSQTLSSFPSISSSVPMNSSELQRDPIMAKKQPASQTGGAFTAMSRRSENTTKNSNSGILMSEEEIIFGHLDTFCNRIKCLLDQFTSLAQFQSLYKMSSTLSRPKREDLNSIKLNKRGAAGGGPAADYDDDEDDDDVDSGNSERAASDARYRTTPNDKDLFNNIDNTDELNKTVSLGILIEENEEIQSSQSLDKPDDRQKKRKELNSNGEVKIQQLNDDVSSDSDFDENEIVDTEDDLAPKLTQPQQQQQQQANVKVNLNPQTLFNMEKNVEYDSKMILRKAQTLSKDDLILMKKYYNRRDEGPTVSSVIENYLKKMKSIVMTIKAAQILDVETKDSKLYQDSYESFINTEADLEKFLAAYLNVIFIKTKKTHDGLHILTKFASVSQRNSLRSIINDKYVEIFANYEKDLDETEEIFESLKNNPPMLRNAPPIGGAISWVRQLLKNIDEPMKVFKDHKYINNLSDFSSTLKKYNKISTSMVGFESYYLNLWKNRIDDARNGLKAYLLIKDERHNTFMVNADEKLLLLFQESKWLLRLNIEIPQAAKELLAQEKKFKQYKSNLDMLLSNYKRVIKTISPHLLDLFESHIRQTLDLCNPGFFILTWNSLNIDSFLKTVENGIAKLENLVELITKTKEASIFKTIDEIRNMYLFDRDLAFDKTWTPDDFVSEINKSVELKCHQVLDKFANIETEIEEIGNLLIVKSKEAKDYQALTNTNGAKQKKTKPNLKEIMYAEPKLNHLRGFYSEHLYNALNESILNSLKCLAEACGFQINNFLGNESQRSDDEDKVEALRNATANGADFNESLRYIRLKTMDDITAELGQVENQRPVSVTTAISKTNWTDERKLDQAFLHLEFMLKYSIPDIVTEPLLEISQKNIQLIASSIINISKSVNWIHQRRNRSFYEIIQKDENIQKVQNLFNTLISEIGPSVRKHLIHFKLFEFLWKEDLNNLFDEFMRPGQNEHIIKREVERLVTIENKVHDIPAYLNIGPICLNTDCIKSSLRTFAYNWKCKYASVLHEIAHSRLEKAIIYRENVDKRLSVNVQTLEQLNDALRLLEELSDMENMIDKIYLPIENIYADLRRFNLILTRQEIEQVAGLRDNWSQLMTNAERVRTSLLQDKRTTLEQELDKQVKTFVVEVIRFRNSFDATGPSVTGIDPYEALKRLNEFQKLYNTFDSRRKTLDSISILFGLQCKPFPELDKTGEELALLNQLYKVYQVFLNFDKAFRNSLWSEIDLNKAYLSIQTYWKEFQQLPDKLKENWEAYHDLERSLLKYIKVLPILLLLNEKEIRNRHWMQVMQVTKVNFRLEASVFKLSDLIDIGLDEHTREIEEICISAKKEQELETKMRSIEEEWNEQVLNFTSYKDYGEICLDRSYTEQLLEQLEDAQEILATMLTSKYVTPLRNEVASWSEKLKTICEVLELWVEAQDLWINLESVFTVPTTIKEMPSEAKRFSRVDKSWIRSQKQSYDIKSVIQCCLGSSVQENTKRALLKDILKELEICFKSLNGYLDKKRRTFPRYHFLSNPALLTLLNYYSSTSNLSDVKPFFSSLFACVYDLKLDEIKDKLDERISSVSSFSLSDKPRSGQQALGLSQSQQQLSFSETPSFFRANVNKEKANFTSSNWEISEVYSRDGEILVLNKKVNLEKGAEVWIPKLKDTISETIKKYVSSALHDLANNGSAEELPIKYPTQICLIGLNYLWTKEIENSLVELKNERKAITMGSKKFAQIISKIFSLMSKSKWNNVDKPILTFHRLRLEAMITYSSYLKDSFESIATKRIKDLNDFEWQKYFRVYVQDENASVMSPRFCVLDDVYNYGTEFYGAEQDYVITPITERSFLSIWQASRIFKGSIVCGKPNTGKTQTSKGLAQFLGKFISIMYCTSQTDYGSIANSLHGIAQDGSWGLFDEIQNLNNLTLSWFNEYTSGIFQALRKRSSQALLADGKEISVNQNFSIISTLNSFKNGESYAIPFEFKSLFRVVCLMEPDIELIIRAKCIQYGIKGSNILASRLKTLYDLCHGSLMSLQSKYQLSVNCFISVIKSIYERQNDDGVDSRPSSFTANQSSSKFGSAKVEILTSQSTAIKELARKSRLALLNYSKNDHSHIAQAIIELISPRLESNDAKLFKKLVQDVLMYKEDAKINALNQSSKNIQQLEKIITEKAASDFKLYPNKNWVEKCLQIYNLSHIFKALILCGPPGCGKSTSLNVLVNCLSEMAKEQSTSTNNAVFKQQVAKNNFHRLKRIYHSANDDEALLYGCLIQNGEFKDGLITSTIRKAARNQSTTWLCLDGQILPSWCDNFSSLFNSDQYLQLKNGDHLKNTCKVVFETGDINNSAPSLLSKTGIIYFGDDVVGWRSIARSWLESRTQNEIQNNDIFQVAQSLQKCFAKTMDEISNYVFKECKPMLTVREETLFLSCLNLLGAMLNENSNIGGEVHIERLYLYCLIWTFGGVLEQNDQKGFSDLLYKLVSALPDDDLKSSVFEYYVDESGEWDLWSQRVPENVFTDNMDLLGNVFVDTIDTIRCRIFLEFSNLAHQNVIIFGPRGCGKTKLMQEFVNSFDANLTTVKRLNFSGATNVSQIQKFIESNIIHRQGFTYGAPDKKQFGIFVDDISSPIADAYNIQKCNEFVRQIIDNKMIYTNTRPFEVKKLEDVCFYSTMIHDSSGKNIDPRLLRHFNLIYLPTPTKQALKSIFNGTLEATMLYNEKSSIDSDLHNAIVEASIVLLYSVNQVLKPCPTPGRQHYLFNMRSIIGILQGLRKLNEIQRNENLVILSLWRNEIFSTIGCQLTRYSDLNWLECSVDELIKEKFSFYIGGNELAKDFVHFKMENRNFDKTATDAQNRPQKNQSVTPIESMDKVRLYLDNVLNRFREEYGHYQINIFLSENAAYHIVRIHRVLTLSQCGNLMLIGTVGNHLTSLIKLAFYLADVQLLTVDCSKSSLFYDSMRAAVRSAGSENKSVGLIFTAKDLIRDEYLDTINSLLNNAECNDLFSNDEMDGLYHAINSSIKREYPNIIIDPKKFFNTRVKKNLHICLTLTPNDDKFKLILQNYVSIISNCQIYWIRDWTDEYLLNEAKYFMKDRLETDELRDKISKCMSEIHSYMLNECKQIPWAGNNEKDMIVELNAKTASVEKKKETQSAKNNQSANNQLQNFPYSRNILNELMRLEHTGEKSKLHFFLSSSTYLRFMNSFWYFFTTKAKQCENDIIRLRKVLETLNKTREGSRAMRSYIKDLKQRCKQSEADSDLALKLLIEMTTKVEKLKAKLGFGGSLATLMQMQDVDLTYQEYISDSKLLNEDPYDEYDKEFTRMRDESQKSKVAKMTEDLEKAKHMVEECKRLLAEKRKQVDVWKNKVDRPCIERVRAFQNPPALIGQIMEMIIVLIGRRKFPEHTFVLKSDQHQASNAIRDKDDKSVANSDVSKQQAKQKIMNKPERLDRTQWKQYQNVMQDSAKFVELLHTIEFEDGMTPEILQGIESYLMKGKEGLFGITGEGFILENAKEVNIPAAKNPDINGSQKGITISAARYASEDAATLVHYTIAILEYCKLCAPLRAAKERVEAIKAEMAENERKRLERENENNEASIRVEENLNAEDLPRLVKELEDLQSKFDLAAVKKYKLNIELESCIQRLEAASLIVEKPDAYQLQLNPNMVSLTNLEDQWKKWIEEHLTHEQTITNCLITAAYVAYCGPFDREIRMKICNHVLSCCQKYDIPKEPQQIFKDLSLPEFLYTPIQLKEIELLRLPITENILENGCYLIEDRSYDNWPLVCDSSRRSINWLKTFYKDKQFSVLRFHEMKSVLETCLSEGHYLLLTDCDVNTIMSNRKLETVLRYKSRFISSDKPFKLNFGTQEIECNPNFRLFLHTSAEPSAVPDYLANYALIVNYRLNRADVEEELLDRFLQLAKPRIDSERYGLLQEKVNTLKIIDPLEQDITNFLASEVDLLNSIEPTKRLSDLKKSYDEAVDSNLRIEIAEEPLTKTRESYREIALRGAICFDAINSLKEININYVLSYKQFLHIFDESLYQFERSSAPQVITKFTWSLFSCLSRMMTELDRKVFSILLSMEIEAAAGRLNVGEREFVISPVYGSYVIQTISGKPINEHKYWTSKKPFDWMLDDQFLNLQYLAISQTWFGEVFDRMARDGRETQWRSLCEAELPENVALPDKLDDSLNPMQRFCIVRAVRGDRIIQISLSFVAAVLGKNYVSATTIDFESIYAESANEKVIILTYTEESEIIKRYFVNFAKSKVANNYLIVDVNCLGLDDNKQLKRIILKAMEEGTWILLHNCHNSPSLLNRIESLVIENKNQKNADANFRCWISLLQNDKPATSLMLNSVRAYIGPSTTMKESIIRCFNWVDSEQIKLSNKSEWPIVLHNLCYIHSCLRLRSRFSRCGWHSQSTLNFSTEEFLEALRVASQEYLMGDTPSRTESVKSISDLNKSLSLQAIKFIIADLIYGCSASNDYDLQAIQAVADYWIGSISNKKDFELTKVKYKIPNSFYGQQAKFSLLQQSLDTIQPLQLESPEACHLLPSIETVLGDDIFIMTRLNKLIDSLPSSNTNVKIFDRPLTPLDNLVVPPVNASSNNPLVNSSNYFSTSGYVATQNKKYNDLNEYCTTILTTKIPKIYSKDQINEKVRKNGGWNTFNYWIVNEMNLLSNLILTIKNHLQMIKSITESKRLGWEWDTDLIEVADNLYNQQIPKSWCLLSGSRTTFSFYPLGSFFNDLIVRFQHVDKCLTLGREKIPAFNLGAYYYPQNLLIQFKYETIKSKNQNDEVGCVEQVVFQSEMTSRDKDHLRDPPKDGIFIYGLYLWGCHWEKGTSELVDQGIKFKEGCISLPVIHLTCWLESEKPLLNDATKAQDLFKCPVYMNRKERDESILEIDMMHSGVPSQKWSMRGVCATLKPF